MARSSLLPIYSRCRNIQVTVDVSPHASCWQHGGSFMSQSFPINPSQRFDTIAASAGQTVLTVPFPFQHVDDIALLRKRAGATVELVLGIDYTLSGEGVPAGGTATLAVGALAGDVYHVIGRALLERLTGIVRSGKFSSEAIDNDLDRLLLIAQEICRDLERGVLAPLGEAGHTLPARAELAGRVLIGDNGGNLTAGPTGVVIEGAQAAADYIADMLDDATQLATPGDGTVGRPNLTPVLSSSIRRTFLEYGAVGNGTTNDTLAVSAALASGYVIEGLGLTYLVKALD